MSKPIGVHLVGSLPFGSTNEALTKTSYALAEHISTIPDGEVGDRWLFTMWQTFAFPPEIHGPMDRNFKPLNNYDFECKYEHIQPTKYDEMAISSYKTFCKLRDEGVIPKGVRFQVSLPTVMNSVWVHADFRYREHVTPLPRLGDSVYSALEFAYLEYERGALPDDFFKPYFKSSAMETALDGITQLSEAIHPDVLLGYHLCYGDLGHKHFIQPKDTSMLVDVANGILERVKPFHAVSWIHLPVPKDRTDDAYFRPLERLDAGDTKLYLGLVHANDEGGTKNRIRAAQAIYHNEFGVATECGMGQTPVTEMDSIFAISRAVAAPATKA